MRTLRKNSKEYKETLDKILTIIERLENENEKLNRGYSKYTLQFLDDCLDDLVENEDVKSTDVENWVLSLNIEDMKKDTEIDIYGERFSGIAEDVLLNYDFDEYTYKWSEHLLNTYRKIVTTEIQNDIDEISEYID